MYDFQLFLTADPSLGRVDCSSMSDQTLMELLIDGFDDETKKLYQDCKGMYLDVCKWSSVKCDANGRVVKIGIHSSNVSGSLALCYIPPKVKVLMRTTWNRRKLTGSVDLTQLPDAMEHLNLCNNELSGEIDLTHLSDRMYYLNLENNNLTGKIDLTQLPDGMGHLNLSNNHLSGEIDVTHLPSGMERLFLNHNQLAGPLFITRVPQWMKMIDLRGNNFDAIAAIDSKTDASIKLEGSGVTSVVDGNGRELDSQRFFE